MDRDRRIEMEVNVATEIAKNLLSGCAQFIGQAREVTVRAVPCNAAQCAHELIEHVLSNNDENLGQDE